MSQEFLSLRPLSILPGQDAEARDAYANFPKREAKRITILQRDRLRKGVVY